MRSDEIIRFALVLSNGQSETFKRNLTKLIKYVLYEASPEAETVSEIVIHIKEMFSINFTESEVSAALSENYRECFVEVKPTKHSSEKRYTIIPSEIEKIKNDLENSKLENVIEKFIKSGLVDEDTSLKEVREILQNYFYRIFNRDVKTLLTMMNHNEIISIDDEDIDKFSEKDRIIINRFLTWEDAEKNKVVYDIVSSCFEFCMMTIKKDNSSFKHIFNGKVFYLDANIIIRLAGFHNDSRKEVIELFVKKCKENGISIKYTNFTKTEIDAVIENQINDIKQKTKGQKPISYEALRILAPAYDNLDFYYQYILWLKETKNKYNNFVELKKYFTRKIQNVLEQFSFESFEKYSTRGKNAQEYFNTAVDSLCEYKRDKHANFYVESVKVDVENYLNIYDKDKNARVNSFLEKKNYFITADHLLLNWARDRVPGTIPTILLPSDWYSIILKYSGRTEDDYKAFVQFLKLPISEHDEKSEDKRKILASVLQLNDSAEVKELIIYDIDERLQKGDRVENIEEFVKESHENVTKTEVEKAVGNIKQEFEAKIKEISETGQAAKDIEYEKGKEEGIQEGQDIVYKNMAKKRVKRNRKILNFISFLEFVVIFVAIILCCICYKNDGLSELNLWFINLKNGALGALIAILIEIIKGFLKRNNILSLDEDFIYGKLKDKLK